MSNIRQEDWDNAKPININPPISVNEWEESTPIYKAPPVQIINDSSSIGAPTKDKPAKGFIDSIKDFYTEHINSMMPEDTSSYVPDQLQSPPNRYPNLPDALDYARGKSEIADYILKKPGQFIEDVAQPIASHLNVAAQGIAKGIAAPFIGPFTNLPGKAGEIAKDIYTLPERATGLEVEKRGISKEHAELIAPLAEMAGFGLPFARAYEGGMLIMDKMFTNKMVSPFFKSLAAAEAAAVATGETDPQKTAMNMALAGTIHTIVGGTQVGKALYDNFITKRTEDVTLDLLHKLELISTDGKLVSKIRDDLHNGNTSSLFDAINEIPTKATRTPNPIEPPSGPEGEALKQKLISAAQTEATKPSPEHPLNAQESTQTGEPIQTPSPGNVEGTGQVNETLEALIQEETPVSKSEFIKHSYDERLNTEEGKKALQQATKTVRADNERIYTSKLRKKMTAGDKHIANRQIEDIQKKPLEGLDAMRAEILALQELDKSQQITLTPEQEAFHQEGGVIGDELYPSDLAIKILKKDSTDEQQGIVLEFLETLSPKFGTREQSILPDMPDILDGIIKYKSGEEFYKSFDDPRSSRAEKLFDSIGKDDFIDTTLEGNAQQKDAKIKALQRLIDEAGKLKSRSPVEGEQAATPPSEYELLEQRKAELAAEYDKSIENQNDAEFVELLWGDLRSGENGKRISITENIDGVEATRWTGYPSSNPEWFKNKGYTRTDLRLIFDKIAAGKPLAPGQLSKWEAINTDFRDIAREAYVKHYLEEDILKETEAYNADIERASGNTGQEPGIKEAGREALDSGLQEGLRDGETKERFTVEEYQYLADHEISPWRLRDYPTLFDALKDIYKDQVIPEDVLNDFPGLAEGVKAGDVAYQPESPYLIETPEDVKALEHERQTQADEAIKTIDSVQAVWGNRGAVQQKVPSTLAKEFREKGFVDYRGQEITDPQKAAEILAVFRNPYIEHFQVLFLKDNVISAHQVTSSGMPNESAVTKRMIYDIISTAKRLGADSIILGHNHPTGNPKPSSADINLTQYVGTKLQAEGIKLREHIITDHENFTYMNANTLSWGKGTHGYLYETDKFLTPKEDIARPTLSEKIDTPEMAAVEAKRFVMDKEKTVVIYIGSELKIIAVDYIAPGKNVSGLINEGIKANKASRYFIAHGASVQPKLNNLPAGLLDIIKLNPDNSYTNYKVPTVADGIVFDPYRVQEEIEGYSRHEEDARIAATIENEKHIAENSSKIRSAKEPNKSLEDLTTAEVLEQTDNLIDASASGVNGNIPDNGEGFISKIKNLLTKKKTPISRKQIAEYFSKELNVVIKANKGRYRFRSQVVQGVYTAGNEIIRTKYSYELYTLSHEIGHDLQKWVWPESIEENGGLTDAPFEPYYYELEYFANQHANPSPIEGFANYMKAYFTNYERAVAIAPDFTKYFEGKLEDAKMKGVIDKGRDMIEKYLRLDPDAAIDSEMSIGEAPDRTKTLSELYKDVVDDLHGLKLAVESFVDQANSEMTQELSLGSKVYDRLMGNKAFELSASQNPLTQMKLLRGWSGKPEHFIFRGTLDYKTLKENGKGLNEILLPVASEIAEFRRYAISKHSLYILDERGQVTAITKYREKAAREIVARDDERYGKTFDELQGFMDRVLQYYRDSGMISDKTYQIIKAKNQIYLPLYKCMEDMAMKGPGSGGGTEPKQIIRQRAEISTGIIIDPIESVLKNLYIYTYMAERNRTMSSLVELFLSKPGFGMYVAKVHKPTIQINLTADEIEKWAEKGVDFGDVPQEELNIFRAGVFLPQQGYARRWVNGESELYEINDPMLYDAFQNMDADTANLITSLLSKPAEWLRMGVVRSPEFMARNILRDPFEAFIFGYTGWMPGYDPLRGFFHALKKDDVYWAFVKAGGITSTFNNSQARTHLQSSLDDVLSKYPELGKMKNPLEALAIIGGKFELANRLGAVLVSLQRQMPKENWLDYIRLTRENLEAATRENLEAAAIAGSEATLDFRRHGAKTKGLRMLDVFINPTIQGTDRIARGFNSRPLPALLKSLWVISIGSILLAWAFHDDKRWKEGKKIRETHWMYCPSDPNAEPIIFPKPRELGYIFGSVFENAVDYMLDEDASAMDEMIDSLTGLGRVSSMNVVPQILLPLLENKANYSYYRDAPIVPDSRKDLLPQHQYARHTSEIAKVLGKALGDLPLLNETWLAKPAMLDNLTKQWTGTLGVNLIDLLSMGIKNKDIAEPEKRLSDVPVVKVFVMRWPNANTYSIQKFYDQYGKLDAAAKSATALIGEGNPEEAVSIIKQYRTQANPDDIKDALSQMNKAIVLVEDNPILTAEEKRENIDKLMMEKITLAQYGLKIIKQVKEEE